MAWSRVADMTQRSVSFALFGLTLVSLGVLAKGGYDVMQRKKSRDAKLLEEQKSAPPHAQQVVLCNGECLVMIKY